MIEALRDILPVELRLFPGAAGEAWNAWASRHDSDIRSRLARGDEDTIVNWLLLGTSFTRRPRAFIDVPALEGSDRSGGLPELSQLIAARAHDLVTALVAVGADERRIFARQFFEQNGWPLANATDRLRLERHLLEAVVRVGSERVQYTRELEEARRLSDQSESFAARSKLFRARGLSLDTSILPSFALEQSLRELKARGLLPAGGVHNVAVIGPGLDFSDKGSGYDFYPQQTIQPFALVDSLVRLGLTDRPSAVRLTTLDISPRVNDHLTRARNRASKGSSYTLRVPIDPTVPWKPEFRGYWNSLGDRIGAVGELPAAKAPLDSLRVRTIAVRPDLLARLDVVDINMVVQRLVDREFDLIVATNVFVYYELLDQALALSNVASMLRPGGLLLSNNAIIELPASRLHSVGYLTTQYSDRPDDGDHVVWYRRSTD